MFKHCQIHKIKNQIYSKAKWEKFEMRRWIYSEKFIFSHNIVGKMHQVG